MKKEIFAATILALLAVISAWNLHYAQKLTTELSQDVDASIELAQSGQWSKAIRIAESASEKWNSADSYTHIFMGHAELELTTDAFGDYLGELYRTDLGGALGAHQKLIEHIQTIYEMERITLKSVF